MTETALKAPAACGTTPAPTLTVIPFDHPRVARAIRRIGDSEQMHQTVMALFPDGLGTDKEAARSAGGVLYRVDSPAHRPPRLLVQHRCPLKADLVGPPLQQAGLGPLLTALRPGMAVHFRTVLNAVRSQTATGKRLAVTDEADLVGWGLERLTGAGLGDVQLAGRPKTELSRAKSALWTAQYDGSANVTDAERLREAVQNGLGRSKAYGCGLLSLAAG